MGYSNIHNAHAIMCSSYREKPPRQHLCIAKTERLLDYAVGLTQCSESANHLPEFLLAVPQLWIALAMCNSQASFEPLAVKPISNASPVVCSPLCRPDGASSWPDDPLVRETWITS